MFASYNMFSSDATVSDVAKKLNEYNFSRYKTEGNARDLQKLIQMIRPFTKLLSKAKAAKLVRGLVDM